MTIPRSRTGEVRRGADPPFNPLAGGAGDGIGGAVGLMLLSQSLADANTRFLAAARRLPQLGASTEAAAKLGAVAGVAAAAFHSLINRIDQWGFPSSVIGGQGRPTASERSAQGQAPESADRVQRDRDRETERLTRAMRESVGRDLLLDGGKPEVDLERDIRTRLQASGADEPKLDEFVTAIARSLRANVEADVRERSSRRNISEPLARQELLAAADEPAHSRSDAEPESTPAEVLSGKEFFDRLLIAGFSRPNDDRIAEAQLREQEKMNAKLEEIKELTRKPKPSTYATFARGRP